jgi:uncharacterized lipoprotein YajG
MTTLFKPIAALLLLLVSWNGQALADQAPPAQSVAKSITNSVVMIVTVQDARKAEIRNPETPALLAWQRVGSPIHEA